jgi:hypothetical protein
LSPEFSDAELDAAIEALSAPGRFAEAEAIVARAAPGLQGVLAAALAEGGWFEESRDDALRSAVLGGADDSERLRAVRTLLAEEARTGMLVGVAVGWALAETLNRPTNEETAE